jgi:hypothetical protein
MAWQKNKASQRESKGCSIKEGLRRNPMKMLILKARKMGTPPSNGTGILWIFRSAGRSNIFALIAKERTSGVKIKEKPAASRRYGSLFNI